MLKRLAEVEIPIPDTASDDERRMYNRLRQRAYRVAQRMWNATPATDRAAVRENIEKRIRE